MIQPVISKHDKTVLRRVGAGAYGKELSQMFARIRDLYLSVETVDQAGDVAAQVAGRILFKDFTNSLIEQLDFQRKQGQNAPDIDEFA